MRIYPAIKAEMGDWQYYIVRMKMREVATEIKFASDIYEDKTLSDAIQRVLDESRVKKSLVSYLARRQDHFFSSLVVAAIGGNPSWYPVEMDASVVPAMIAKSKALNDSFGILSFDEDPKYYALDGQHRLKAIKMLIDGEADDFTMPEGFEEEQISVIVVLRGEITDDAEWRRRYRRLFSSLNRYAKPTDADTNIIMDEDDVFAIITRRLITEHEFFQAPGRERESFKVQTKGKNLRADSSHFISLQTLYEVNKSLLTTTKRQNQGWGSSGENRLKQFIQFRPEEELLDAYYEELARYWDGILSAFPELRRQAPQMRCHDLPSPNPDNYQDHLIFWPIGQELFAELARDLLDQRRVGTDSPPEVSAVKSALKPLGAVGFELHNVPWVRLLLVGPFPEEPHWRMRSEDRKAAIDVAKRIVHWVLGLDPLNEDETAELRKDWFDLLYPQPSKKDSDALWSGIEAIAKKVRG